MLFPKCKSIIPDETRIINTENDSVLNIEKTEIANKFYKKKYKNLDLDNQWLDIEDGINLNLRKIYRMDTNSFKFKFSKNCWKNIRKDFERIL